MFTLEILRKFSFINDQSNPIDILTENYFSDCFYKIIITCVLSSFYRLQ